VVAVCRVGSHFLFPNFRFAPLASEINESRVVVVWIGHISQAARPFAAEPIREIRVLHSKSEI
jgi:hypothetical protein